MQFLRPSKHCPKHFAYSPVVVDMDKAKLAGLVMGALMKAVAEPTRREMERSFISFFCSCGKGW